VQGYGPASLLAEVDIIGGGQQTFCSATNKEAAYPAKTRIHRQLII